ncbi:MAG: monovalent cation/H(+) antiporter subunit G [Syntrophales bacterium]|jgi:multicomponent Na+:H+ antiporter subunit G|nr:monovalent cation/H(+) antiporter subunit G [Syntrophales bacterium]MCK9528142.1 monovalent cation/H(+) antiporter subunit G [Syntrophales bacterium]MDX9921112.1 monovalent cation/H(+) antiporter subunit G [Syntrophales bacterium]
MIEIQIILAAACIIMGAFFLFVGSLGIIKFPDFYSRAHAVSVGDTLGIILVLGGLMIYEGFSLNSGKLFIAILFVAHATPTGSHAIARAAYRGGLKPWFGPAGGDEKK